MKVLFVLGNGFDLALGLHTSYQDFYEYYLNQPSNSDVISRLKEHLSEERYRSWADLELGLGEYTIQVNGIEEMQTIYYDLSDSLRVFLKNEENAFSTTDKTTNAVISGLASPHLVLPQGMQDSINSFRNGYQPYVVDVISYNYTNTLEAVLQSSPKTNGMITLDPQTVLGSIKHVHMRLEDGDVIMGVNDDSQIPNKEILTNDLRSLLVKPYINQQLQNRVDSECDNLIRDADLFCLFGVSVGKTDLMWWKRIGDRFQQSNARIIFFAYDNENVTRNFERISKYNKYKKLLFNRMGILNPSPNQYNRVFVGYKTKLFT